MPQEIFQIKMSPKMQLGKFITYVFYLHLSILNLLFVNEIAPINVDIVFSG